MRHTTGPPETTRRTARILMLGLVGSTVVIAATFALQTTGRATPAIGELLGSSSVLQDSTSDSDSDSDRSAAGDGAVTEYDGIVPNGVTPFNENFAAVAELDPELLRALRTAAIDAADDHVTFYVNSGWRSAEYQMELLREAVVDYGSVEEAGRWVATPETSAHVSGDAVDIGSWDAATWLSEHGVRYGLCQTYRNEPWHFELRPAATDRGCPRMFSDPTEDPRMHR